jgi:hypothetical protein
LYSEEEIRRELSVKEGRRKEFDMKDKNVNEVHMY